MFESTHMMKLKGQISLDHFNLESVGLFTNMLLLSAKEALDLAFADDNTAAFFPAEYGDSDGLGGPAPVDPLTVYFQIALDGDDEGPYWQTSLSEMLEDTIGYCARDGSFSKGLERIRDGLRELADKIDAALPSNVRGETEPTA